MDLPRERLERGYRPPQVGQGMMKGVTMEFLGRTA